ncbi:arp2/3 complex subunit [Malassezia cuniculi]|uniref:Actin-related protein 2/3 complex subunit 5 n=1 Tax=Malassezia cuniculi TaxID=948313 RepID=A0AAF0ET18_9BASI|nr:arp2/3 complex subunit [Malassezia cuniculi]
MSDSFRRLDVDQYDEDALRPEDIAEVDHKSPEQALSLAQQKQTAVRARVSANDTAGALAVLLEDVPFGAANDQARRLTFSLLLEILNATRVADIAGAVRGLDVLQRDTLMKYLYKGLALGGTEGGASQGINCAVLLSWHEKLTQAAGTGCIVRVMSNRREL